jgi:hypothetical protein
MKLRNPSKGLLALGWTIALGLPALMGTVLIYTVFHG